jgi:hypothetical protein
MGRLLFHPRAFILSFASSASPGMRPDKHQKLFFDWKVVPRGALTGGSKPAYGPVKSSLFQPCAMPERRACYANKQ